MNTSISRRAFLKSSLAALAASQISGLQAGSTQKPNILFVAFDDLNSWVNCLGGYKGKAITPNIDALAASGTLFTNAHCSIPLCNGSRVSTLTGISPLQTRVYENTTVWRDMPGMKSVKTLPQIFRENSYRAIGSGKVFHHHDSQSWDEYWPNDKLGFPQEPVEPDNEHPRKGGPPQYRMDATFDWSVIDTPIEQMPDYQVASWISAQLLKPQTQPLFIGCGFGKPHLPWYLPQQYFDRYPLDSVQLPAVLANDLDDVPEAARALVNEYLHKDIVRYGFWKKAVQAYLASITFADEQLGRVLQTLRQSALADNTIVVLWSDHGWHLGEKLQWRKLTLWEEATHIPLIMSGPGITTGQRCKAPVSTLDIAPTLLAAANISTPRNMQGRNLMPLLKTASASWPYAAITSWENNSIAVRSQDFRYIEYADGSEELYDHRNDPHEWHNLINTTEYREVRQQLRQHLDPVREHILHNPANTQTGPLAD